MTNKIIIERVDKAESFISFSNISDISNGLVKFPKIKLKGLKAGTFMPQIGGHRVANIIQTITYHYNKVVQNDSSVY